VVKNKPLQAADWSVDPEPTELTPAELDRSKGLPFAKEWLRTLLRRGRIPATDIYQVAELEVDENGKRRFSKRTLDKAKKELGVQSDRSGFGGIVYWELSEHPFATNGVVPFVAPGLP